MKHKLTKRPSVEQPPSKQPSVKQPSVKQPLVKRLLVHLRRRRGRWARRVLAGLLALVLALVGTVWVAYLLTTIPAPHPETVSQSTVFLDAEGEYLGRRGPVDRQDVPLSQVPRHVQDAVIAAENRSFRTDSGVSPSAIVRAALATLSGGERQGGSTITQQYVKNALLSPEQSLTRKAREALISVKLDRTRSKDAILEGYLNTVYFGRGAAGIESAARNYFGVDAEDLTVAQGAALAAVINRPTYYERAGSDGEVTATLQKRWRWVLDAMRSSGSITAAQRSSAAFPAFRFYPPGDTDGQRQYLIDAAATEAARRLGISQDQLARGGYTVRTTFDLSTQYAVSERVREREGALTLPKGTRLHAAVIAMVPGDGAVRVLYGGTDYAHQPFNDALSGAVEAGTALRPFTGIRLGAPLTGLARTAAPTPLTVASAYATAAARGTYAAPYTVARITRGGHTLYTAHPDRHRVMDPGTAATTAKYATVSPLPVFTGGAGTGPGTRTLWQSAYTPRLALTTALFAEHPATRGHRATPAHLPAAAGDLAAGVRSDVFASTAANPARG